MKNVVGEDKKNIEITKKKVKKKKLHAEIITSYVNFKIETITQFNINF